MANLAYNISNYDFNEKVYFNDIQSIPQSYYEVISNTSIITIVFKNIKRNFQNTSKKLENLKNKFKPFD